MEVTEDQVDHLDMSSEEIEEYRELLRQLEPTSEEESYDSSKDTSQLVQYFWCDKWFAIDFDVF